MFSLFCLLASCTILFFILRFRVHIHVTYTPTNSRRSSVARKRGGELRGPGVDTSTAKTRPEKFSSSNRAAFVAPVQRHGDYRTSPTQCDGSERGQNGGPQVNAAPTLQKFNEFVPVASNLPERNGPIACPVTVCPDTTRAARLSDIASGLTNLGCDKRIARNVAAKVVSEYPDATIETQLSVALQQVGRAA